ncbi:MAG: STAS domain-containing protein [Lentisphaeria bacterium]
MEIITEKVGAVFKMAINGRLVVSTTEAFKNALAEAISENQWIVLDLTEMSYIDSSGLGAMVFAQQKLSEKGGSLRLAGLQPKPRIVFDITKVYRIFEIFDNIETAIESFPTTE